VRLVPHEVLPHPAKDAKLLEHVVREAFNQRRKTLRNTMKGLLDSAAIEAAGVDGSLRPEQLDLAPSCAWPTSWPISKPDSACSGLFAGKTRSHR
jgi:dimethyladenosine transferase (EC 2.1.1.-)